MGLATCSPLVIPAKAGMTSGKIELGGRRCRCTCSLGENRLSYSEQLPVFINHAVAAFIATSVPLFASEGTG